MNILLYLSEETLIGARRGIFLETEGGEGDSFFLGGGGVNVH